MWPATLFPQARSRAMSAPVIARPDSRQAVRGQTSPEKNETSQQVGHVSPNSIQSNVAPVMTVLEMNKRHGLICACPRRFQCGTEPRDGEHATASSLYFTAFAFSPGMKNL